jgi:hypothetical protein
MIGKRIHIYLCQDMRDNVRRDFGPVVGGDKRMWYVRTGGCALGRRDWEKPDTNSSAQIREPEMLSRPTLARGRTAGAVKPKLVPPVLHFGGLRKNLGDGWRSRALQIGSIRS